MSTSMRKRGSLAVTGGAALSAIVGLFLLAVPGIAGAQTCGGAGQSPCSGTFLNGYFDVSEAVRNNGTGDGDNIIRITNPIGSANPGIAPAVDQCAMIYVFDDNEHLSECCGCPLSPQGLLALSVQHDLTANWNRGRSRFLNNQAGLVDIVSTGKNHLKQVEGAPKCSPSSGCNQGCDPTNFNTYVPSGQLKGYITHNSQAASVKLNGDTKTPTLTTGLTEVSLADSGNPDSAELTFLQNQCEAFVGTGSGICDCGPDLN
jgi:hypothetical protein